MKTPGTGSAVRRWARPLVAIALAGGLLAAAGRVAETGAARRPGPEVGVFAEEAFPSGLPRLAEAWAPALPGGVRRLLADLSWLAAVQHYGRTRLAGGEEFPRLASLIRLGLRFDPGLRPAALEGALLLAEPPPLGAGDPEMAVALLDEWTARRPGDWEAWLLAGLVRRWHLQDPAGAAAVFASASRQPGAPDWFTWMGARSLTASGDRAEARRLWRAARDAASSERARTNATIHLLQLDALDRLDALAGAVGRFRESTGRAPGGWAEMVAAGFLERIPRDPRGVPYRLGEDGAVEISRASPLAGAPRLPGASGDSGTRRAAE